MTIQDLAWRPLSRTSPSRWMTGSEYTVPREEGSAFVETTPSRAADAWRRYLDELVRAGVPHARVAWECWTALTSDLGDHLPLPQADVADDGRLLVWWDSARRHAELEIGGDERVEWFVRDHASGEFDGDAWSAGREAPSRFVETLAAITQDAGAR